MQQAENEGDPDFKARPGNLLTRRGAHVPGWSWVHVHAIDVPTGTGLLQLDPGLPEELPEGTWHSSGSRCWLD